MQQVLIVSMLLSADPLELHCQLSWLLSAEAQVAFCECLQPRATCLPLAQQQALILSATSLLSQEHHGATSAPDAVTSMTYPTRSALLQLLELLAGNNSCCTEISTIQQTARMALEQQQQQAPLRMGISRVCSQLQSAAALPAWLTASTQHSFSWLSRRAVLEQPGLTATATASAAVVDAAHASQQRAATVTREEAEQAPCTAVVKQTQHQEQKQEQEHMETDLPTAKRAKLSFHSARQGVTDHTEAPGSAAARIAAAGAACTFTTTLNASTVQQVVQQLQEVNSTCDACHVDAQLLHSTLTAAASAAAQQTVHADLLLGLQQQLQQLSADALQPLLNALLPLQPGGCTDSTSGGTVMSESGVAYLLATAVLPRLQQLDSAAPQTLLASLATVAKSHLDVFVSVVLQPLLCTTGLAPVQVQLLRKLMKEVSQLPTRVLQLLVTAAAGGQTAAASAAQPPAVLTSTGLLPGASGCCWNDPHAVLMRSMADSHLQVVTDQLESVITALTVAARQPALIKSKSFGQLLLAVVTNYAGVMTKRQVEQLQSAAAATSTFMTKNLAFKLQQLAAQHAAAAAPMQQ